MTWTKQVSVHGKRVFLTPDDRLAARDGFIGGGDDNPGIVIDPGSYRTVAKSYDFVGGDTGDFTYLSGDTGQSSGVAAVTGGVFRLFNTPSTTPTQTSAGNEEINSGVAQWKADQGPGNEGLLHFGCRIKMSSVSRTANRGHVFAGFKDVATIEHPAYDTGAGVISASADYVGFMFSPGGDTGWSGVAGKSVAGDSGDQVVALDTGAAANTYDFLEVIIRHGPGDTGGVATFFVNGEPKGSINSPVASTVALVPCVSMWQQDTGNAQADIDIVNFSALRDTGA